MEVDPVAPVGSISSAVFDMAKWLRFLLAGGMVDEERLISEEALKETWTEQIKIRGSVDYGIGWMLRDWQEQRVIEHGSAVPDGFSAKVAVLSDSDLGFVLLSNSYPTHFPSLFINLVPRTLLGEWTDDDSEDETEDFRPYLSRYIVNFRDEVFTIVEHNRQLDIEIPSQMAHRDLNPLDEDELRQYACSNRSAVSFVHDDNGSVVGIKVHNRRSRMVFEVPRKGVEIEPKIDLDELHKCLSSYQVVGDDEEITLLILNQRLAFEMPNGLRFDLHPPDDAGRWVSHTNADILIAFDEAENGAIVGLELHRPGGAPVIKFRTANGNEALLPTVEEIIAPHQTAQSSA